MAEKPLVIFGAGKIAEVVLHYFRHHCRREVAAITVDAAYRQGETWMDLPLVPFEEVEAAFPPDRFDCFVALGYHEMNALRAGKVAEVRAKGYRLVSCLPVDGSFPSNCRVGENCFVMPGAMVHPCVTLGENVFVWSGAIVGHHSVVGDHCWITSGANLAGNVRTGANCFFAINSTVVDGVTVGDRCFLGANALLAKSAEAGGVYIEKGTDRFRLDTDQFLKLSRFQSF